MSDIQKKFYPFLVPNDQFPGTSLKEDIPYGETPIFSKQALQNGKTRYSYFTMSLPDMFRWNAAIKPEERHFFEVIEEGPQKLHFDLDMSRSDMGNTFSEQNADRVRDYVIWGIKLVFAKYCLKLDVERDVLLFSSHGKDKYSFHIVIDNYYVTSSAHSRHFTQDVIDVVPDEISKYIDISVNKRNQQFRLLDSTKIGTVRNKSYVTTWTCLGEKIVTKIEPYIKVPQFTPELVRFICFKRSLVGHVDLSVCKHIDFPLPGTVTQTYGHSAPIGDVDRKAVLELVPKGYTVTKITDDDRYFYLKAKNGTSCINCHRVHDNENQYICVIGNKQLVVFKCRRDNKSSTRLGLLKPAETDSVPMEPVKITEENTTIKYVGEINPVPGRIIVLHHYLGSGKTVSCINYVRKHQPKRVLILSPRRLYAKSICAEYNIDKPHLLKDAGEPFQCYLDLYGQPLDHVNRLVLQMESLHKVKGLSYDVLILDEIEALLTQFSSKTTMKRLIECATVFERLVKETPVVITADAFVSDKTKSVMSQLKPLDFNVGKFRGVPRKCIMLKDFNVLLRKLSDQLELGKNCYFVCASREKAKDVYRYFESRGVQAKIYVGGGINADDLSHVNEVWNRQRLVITTSTITCGVNFDLEHFDVAFIYASTYASTARDIIQSSMRVRHLKDNKVYAACYSVPVDKSLPTKEIDVVKYLKTVSLMLLKHWGKAWKSMPEYWGKAWKSMPDWLYTNHVKNIKEGNQSKQYIDIVLKRFLLDSNYIIERDTTNECIMLKGEKTTPKYNDIPSIYSDEFKKLKKLKQTYGVTLEEQYMIDKFFFDKNCRPGVDVDTRSDWYNHHFLDFEGKRSYYNILYEKKGQYEDKSKADTTYLEQGSIRPVMCDIINKLVSSLGMSHSTQNVIIEQPTYMSVPENLLDKYFTLKPGGKSKAKKDYIRKKNDVSSILINWSGGEVDNKKVKRKQRNGVRTREYPIERSVEDYWEFLKGPSVRSSFSRKID